MQTTDASTSVFDYFITAIKYITNPKYAQEKICNRKEFALLANLYNLYNRVVNKVDFPSMRETAPMPAIPEPSLTPVDDPFVIANCGHEVYDGEALIDWTGAKGIKTLCPDCFRDKLAALSVPELAQLFGCDYTTVETHKH